MHLWHPIHSLKHPLSQQILNKCLSGQPGKSPDPSSSADSAILTRSGKADLHPNSLESRLLVAAAAAVAALSTSHFHPPYHTPHLIPHNGCLLRSVRPQGRLPRCMSCSRPFPPVPRPLPLPPMAMYCLGERTNVVTALHGHHGLHRRRYLPLYPWRCP